MPSRGAHRRRSQFARSLSSGNFRAWGFVLSAAAWIGLVICIPLAPPLARTLFAVVDALTWGAGAATYAPVDDGVEFTLVSAGASIALLVLAGTAMVWIQITSAMIATFVVFGGVSLLLQGPRNSAREITPH